MPGMRTRWWYTLTAGSKPSRWSVARVFALSSIYEGFGNVLVEALATGCAIVSTDCPGGPPEILDGGRFGTLVPMGDPHAFAAGIETALDSPPDPAILERVRATIQKGLAGWGKASLADSRRSEGVQIADVIANSLFNIEAESPRAARIETIVAPMLASKAIRVARLAHLP